MSKDLPVCFMAVSTVAAREDEKNNESDRVTLGTEVGDDEGCERHTYLGAVNEPYACGYAALHLDRGDRGSGGDCCRVGAMCW